MHTWGSHASHHVHSVHSTVVGACVHVRRWRACARVCVRRRACRSQMQFLNAVVEHVTRCEVVVKCGRSNMVVARVLWGSCRLLKVLRRSVYCKSQLDVFVDVLVGVSATSLCATR